MFHWIISSSLKFRYLIVAAFTVMLIYGLDRISVMQVDVFPRFAPPVIKIQAEGPGMSAVEVEELVTVPLEQALRGAVDLDIMRSKSVTGLSEVKMIFKSDVDLLEARQLVHERLATIASQMPVNIVAPVMLPPMSSVSRVMHIGLSSKTLSLDDLSMAAFWKLQFRLKKVQGVASIVMWGFRNKQLLVQVDPEKMRYYGVTLSEVKKAAGNVLKIGLLKYTRAAKGQGEGFIETGQQRLTIRHDLGISSAPDLSKVVVKNDKNGKPIFISDVAEVRFSHDKPIGEAVVHDGPGLLILVQMFPWANIQETTRGLDAAIEELRPAFPGIDIDNQIFRPARYVEMSISNLSHAMILGALIVVFILIFFLFEWRVALISSVAIPVSLVASALVLYWQNETINVMVLAGFFVALGAIVDDAIIDIENIMRRLRENRELAANQQKSTGKIILDASMEVRRPIVYATIIILLSVMPVFNLHGVSKAFFSPLVYSYSLALLASMVVALTITPALAYILLRKGPLRTKEAPLVSVLKRSYMPLLKGSMRYPVPTILITAFVAAMGILTWPMLSHTLMPGFKEPDILVKWLTKPGTSRVAAYRTARRACAEFMTIPNVRTCGSHIGRAISGPEVHGMNYMENWVSIKDVSKLDETIEKVREAGAGYPGIRVPQLNYIRERIKQVLSGASQSVVVRIFGPDLKTLRQKALEVKKALTDVEGLKKVKTGFQTENPQIQIKVNIAKAAVHGLTPGDISRAVSAMLNGMEVSDVFRNGRIHGVMIWSLPKHRDSFSDLQDLLIDTPIGGHVRLSEVADIAIKPTPNAVLRENFSRRIDVKASVYKNADFTQIISDVEAQLATVDFPLEYRAEILGEPIERAKALKQLGWVSLLAALGILLMLQASFGSWKLAFMTFLALPAALVGGVIATYMSGGIVSLGSLVGLLTILGVAARNGVLLVSHYQHLEKSENMPFGLDLVLRGAGERLAPILMTSLSTGLAMVPLIIGGVISGHELQHPMAVVIVGGLVTSTLLSLFVIPMLYLWYGDKNILAKAGQSSGSRPFLWFRRKKAGLAQAAQK
ncbi:MAG: efflux RND transporter permease subunit [Hyphomicrobiaceae bacterium]|nr:efflux RND transporter permease subunit [Hyphomicrobiaceae bacterium]